MNDEINLKTELLQYCTNLSQNIEIKGTTLNLNLKAYNNIGIVTELSKWQSCFGILGKGNIYVTKEISKIIYCLLTDTYVLEDINNIDLFNPIFSRFLQIEPLSKNNRTIRLRVFPICNTLIIIDWKQYPNYKIYELYNIDQVKEFYRSNKVNFDTVVQDIKLQPVFSGDISDLESNFKILGLNRFKDNREHQINLLETFLSNYRILEREIQKEYKKLIKKPSKVAYSE